jgi:hypothetical protein
VRNHIINRNPDWFYPEKKKKKNKGAFGKNVIRHAYENELSTYDDWKRRLK